MIFGALPILYFAGFKRRKMDKFTPDRRNITSEDLINQPVKMFLQIAGTAERMKFSENLHEKNVVFFSFR